MILSIDIYVYLYGIDNYRGIYGGGLWFRAGELSGGWLSGECPYI